MKKCVSVLLAVLLFVSILPLSAAAVEIKENYDLSKPPVLLIDGINAVDLARDIGTKDEKTVYPFTADDVLALIQDNWPAVWDVLDGDFTQENEAAVIDAAISLLQEVEMNDDGTSLNNIEADWLYPLQTRERVTGDEEQGFDISKRLNEIKNWFSSLFQEEITEEETMQIILQSESTYKYRYDWRLDPYENAEGLRDYIEYMKELTGYDTFSLVGFSQGATVLNTYLSLYGYEDLESVVWYCGAHNGVELVGQLFTGRIGVDPETLTQYLANPYSKDASAELVAAIVKQLNMLGVTGGILRYTDKIIKKLLADGAIRRLIRETVGKMPGIWSLISDEYYEEAKAYVFNEPGDETRFAALLEKIDAYHYNVQAHSAEIMATAKVATGKIGVIAKYGRSVIPIIEHRTVQADGVIDVKGASCGATAADLGATLGENYVQAVNDGHNHLSADGVIDASTALYPDYTWFIKNQEHSQGGDYQHALINKIAYADGQFTVFDDADFPQFSVYSPIDNTTAPLTDGKLPGAFMRAMLRIKVFFMELIQKIRGVFIKLLLK